MSSYNSGLTMVRHLLEWIEHIRKEHYLGDKARSTCRKCQFNWFFLYATITAWWWFPPLYHWIKAKDNKDNNKINNINKSVKEKETMKEMNWILLLILLCAFGVVQIFLIAFEHWIKKRKYSAESENIELKNKITKEITYEQLEKSNKFKNISNSLQIYQQIVVLEEEIKKDQDPESRKRRLEMLEGIRKIFKEEQNREEKTKKLKDKEK
jgi:hypothetical protein